jgi:hypothetical protein
MGLHKKKIFDALLEEMQTVPIVEATSSSQMDSQRLDKTSIRARRCLPNAH